MSTGPELERQVERASLFTHSALGRSANHMREMETFLYGLVDVLLAKRVVAAEEAGAALERVEQALKHRPGTCRRYSCANDRRIWTDFERMEPNTVWLAENLAADGPRILHAMLQTS